MLHVRISQDHIILKILDIQTRRTKANCIVLIYYILQGESGLIGIELKHSYIGSDDGLVRKGLIVDD